jgi:TRAP-type mannitol/chloroaromatic compound transport system permease large subunit
MEIAILFGVFALLLVLGVPVAFSIAVAALATVVYLGLPPVVVVQQVASGFNKLSLLAIPLFIFAGELMLRGGISERLIALASSLVGHLRGGLGQVSVVASTLFGGVSGSALADVSAIGSTMIPQMEKRGFSKDYAVDVTISAALVALLLPDRLTLADRNICQSTREISTVTSPGRSKIDTSPSTCPRMRMPGCGTRPSR